MEGRGNMVTMREVTKGPDSNWIQSGFLKNLGLHGLRVRAELQL